MPRLIKSLITQKNRKKYEEAKTRKGHPRLNPLPSGTEPSPLTYLCHSPNSLLLNFSSDLPHVFFRPPYHLLFSCFTVCSPALCICLKSLSSLILFSTSFPSLAYFSVPSKIFASSPFIANARHKQGKKKLFFFSPMVWVCWTTRAA